MKVLVCLTLLCGVCCALDLSKAGVSGQTAGVAKTVLIEEIEKRTGLRLSEGRGIELAVNAQEPGIDLEGYSLQCDETRVRIAGRTQRGLLYGVGAFLRRIDWGPGKLSLNRLAEKSSPASTLRGHQLGYRAAANSWDAWTVAQYDQYIRELVFFGVNAIENIPFQDAKPAPLMKLSRRDMNREISRICQKYGIEYWVWLPADFELEDLGKKSAFLLQFEQMTKETARLDAVFVPGGDPGDNSPQLVMPLLEELASRTKAKIWLSLQGFRGEKEDYVYRWIREKKPSWLGGLVAGPSSPPAARSRQMLPREYGLRLYPDITHNKICQYQVPEWDQAFALTLGREAINPRAAEMVRIHNKSVGLSNGFISYSDGVHDDVNKVVFSALGWDATGEAREILVEYARLHFSSEKAGDIADAILALERNWRGPLIENGGVEATRQMWERLTTALPELSKNWRWQMCQLRATYDAYTRRRLIHERGLETRANAILRLDIAPDEAMDRAITELARVGIEPDLRVRIEVLCAALFESIGLQTSVAKYGASGAERGAVLDFVDYPLNNRWWIEDEFQKVRAMKSGNLKKARLLEIATWEEPGAGSFYDDIGNEGRSPHAGMDERDEPMFWWLDQGLSRLRLSSQTTMWPKNVIYEGLVADGVYVVKTGGQGQSLLSIDGKKVEGKKAGTFFEFSVPREALEDGRVELSWEIPKDEGHLNWRQRSRLAEVWLLKQN